MSVIKLMIAKNSNNIIRLFGGFISFMNLICALTFLANTSGQATYGVNAIERQNPTFDGKNKVVDALKLYRGLLFLPLIFVIARIIII